MGLGSSQSISPVLKTVSEQTMRQKNLQVTLEQLQKLMECRGLTMAETIQADFGTVEQLCIRLGVQPTEGISPTEENIALRQRVYGKNQVNFKRPKSFLTLVYQALKDKTLIMLEFCALLSFVLSFCKVSDTEGASDSEYDQAQQHEDKYGWIESAAILVSILIIVLVSAGNDYAKERQFRVLQSQLEKEHKVSVLRDRAVSEVPVTSLVVGDVCLLKYGDIIPADGILFECNELKIDESSLTGESDLVTKSLTADPVILSGTHVMEGGGRMVVTAVGVHSQSGIIYSLMRSGDHTKTTGEGEDEEGEEEYSVLQKKLRDLALRIGYVGIGIAVFTMITMITKYLILKFVLMQQPFRFLHVIMDLFNFLIIGVTILVVAVPEGLPLAVTLSLAYSVRQMMKDNNLVRHLDACETMGNATIICSDKTGTLTANKMTAVKCYLCGTFYGSLSKRFLTELPTDVVTALAQSIALNSQPTSQLERLKDENKTVKQLGNKTECALLGLLFHLHVDYRKVRERFPSAHLHRIYPFNSARKLMRTVICLPSGGFRVLAKGASEIILKKCKYIVGEKGKILELSEEEKDRLTSMVIRKMAQEGLRTIMIAYVDYLVQSSQLPNAKSFQLDSEPDWDAEESYTDLTCLAVIGIEDPIRKDVPEAIVRCQRAGISIRMVTGDNVDTARAVARKCGIISQTAADSDDLVLESKEFNRVIRDAHGKVDQQRFDLVWPRLKVLARSTPADKYTLVKHIIESRLNPNREVVAVTGDGTNDAPALKMADVGFAMGIAGTEVAKEASDIILTDDNFSSIVKAVTWGRNVYDCITKFIQFQLTVNIVAVLVAFISVCVISESPLKAVQMLWVNLIMDTLGSLALSTEKPSKLLLLRKPYGRNQSIISSSMCVIILCNSTYQFVLIMLMLFYGDQFFNIDSGIDPSSEASSTSLPSVHFTMIFNTFVFLSLFNEINSRKINGERNVFKGLCDNWIFTSIFIITTALQVVIVQFGNISFTTCPLNFCQWLWCITIGFSMLVWNQIIVAMTRKRQ